MGRLPHGTDHTLLRLRAARVRGRILRSAGARIEAVIDLVRSGRCLQFGADSTIIRAFHKQSGSVQLQSHRYIPVNVPSVRNGYRASLRWRRGSRFAQGVGATTDDDEHHAYAIAL